MKVQRERRNADGNVSECLILVAALRIAHIEGVDFTKQLVRVPAAQ